MAQMTPNKDGTITAQDASGSWAPFGVKAGDVRPETPESWHPAAFTEAMVQSRYGATLEQLLSWAETIGFPRPCRNVQIAPAPGTHGIRRKYEWDPTELAAFDDRIRAMYARLPKAKR